MGKKRRARPLRQRQRQTVKLTRRQIAAQLAKQRENRLLRQEKKRAVNARKQYKPRKSDRGKIVMAGVNGQRNPQAKGRKGYLLYVTKTGKKWLIKQTGQKHPYKSRKFTDFEPPTNRLRKAAKAFEASKRVVTQEGKAVVKGSNYTRKSRRGSDFNDKIISKIANSIKKTSQGQASKRNFQIVGFAHVTLPNGKTLVFEFELPFQRRDHLNIRLAGVKSFVKHKFYMFMARELARYGYVSSGSANHIRRLADNRGLPQDEWTDKSGQPWHGRDLEIVHINSIHWRIEQNK